MNRIASDDFRDSQSVARPDDLNAVVVHTQLHPGVLYSVAGSYAYLLGVFWLLFFSTAPGAIVMAVSTFFFLMYIGTPLLMARIGGHRADGHTGLGTFLAERFSTHTGEVSGWQAFIQINTVPVGLALCVTGIAFAIVHSM